MSRKKKQCDKIMINSKTSGFLPVTTAKSNIGGGIAVVRRQDGLIVKKFNTGQAQEERRLEKIRLSKEH